MWLGNPPCITYVERAPELNLIRARAYNIFAPTKHFEHKFELEQYEPDYRDKATASWNCGGGALGSSIPRLPPAAVTRV